MTHCSKIFICLVKIIYNEIRNICPEDLWKVAIATAGRANFKRKFRLARASFSRIGSRNFDKAPNVFILDSAFLNTPKYLRSISEARVNLRSESLNEAQ